MGIYVSYVELCHGNPRQLENLCIMVENTEDVPGETKPNFVEFSGVVKPPKVEAKPNINGASKYVDSVVLPLQAHKVDTAMFFFRRH
ncbi:hypothetical protein MTR_0360s0020 [Medicago truncatula]|uniref:Uncharacterized protein n=1 Tax=Medicago truncatula TaxID=3880 RepID=A0A072TR55_MEDTR|nr:hypothetical protein MTR_0360s0020 [Medicago truncatula]